MTAEDLSASAVFITGGAAQVRHLVLIGYMGSGKSTAGKRAAELIGLPYVDTDQLVEERSGRIISEIFETDGEAAFRNWEREIIQSLMQREPHVISTGGGAPMIDGMMDLMLSHAGVVYLRAEPRTLARRVSGCRTRPLLGDAPSLKKISDMLEGRRAVYEKAHCIIDTDHLTVTQTVQAIVAWWREGRNTGHLWHG